MDIFACRVATTMMVSAFWHGIHAGYYLSFITIPINLIAEDTMIKAFRNKHTCRIFDWFCWFFKMRSFDYMCMAFLLLSFNDTICYWKSIYFIGHVCIVAFIVIGSVPFTKTDVSTSATTHYRDKESIQ